MVKSAVSDVVVYAHAEPAEGGEPGDLGVALLPCGGEAVQARSECLEADSQAAALVAVLLGMRLVLKHLPQSQRVEVRLGNLLALACCQNGAAAPRSAAETLGAIRALRATGRFRFAAVPMVEAVQGAGLSLPAGSCRCGRPAKGYREDGEPYCATHGGLAEARR